MLIVIIGLNDLTSRVEIPFRFSYTCEKAKGDILEKPLGFFINDQKQNYQILSVECIKQ
jgi:hypothetical protein